MVLILDSVGEHASNRRKIETGRKGSEIRVLDTVHSASASCDMMNLVSNVGETGSWLDRDDTD